MKIQSDFADYYDSCEESNSTQNCSITYLRNSKSLPLPCRFNQCDYLQTVKHFDEIDWSINYFLIGYCGKIQPGVEVRVGLDSIISYTYSGLFHLAKSLGIDVPKSFEFHTDKHFKKPYTLDDSIFIDLGTPLFVIKQMPENHDILVINPTLADYQFYKIASAPKLFNRIFSYIDEVMDPLPPMACYQAVPQRIIGRRWYDESS